MPETPAILGCRGHRPARQHVASGMLNIQALRQGRMQGCACRPMILGSWSSGLTRAQTASRAGSASWASSTSSRARGCGCPSASLSQVQPRHCLAPTLSPGVRASGLPSHSLHHAAILQQVRGAPPLAYPVLVGMEHGIAGMLLPGVQLLGSTLHAWSALQGCICAELLL